MFSVWVTLEVQVDREEHFREAIEENAEASVRDEPGCVSFDVIELDRERRRYAFYERYSTAEAFYLDHRQSPHYAEWTRAVETDVVPGSQVVTVGDLWVRKG